MFRITGGWSLSQGRRGRNIPWTGAHIIHTSGQFCVMQTPHRKAPARELHPTPSCCEASALTTKPPYHHIYACMYLFIYGAAVFTSRPASTTKPIPQPHQMQKMAFLQGFSFHYCKLPPAPDSL